MKKLLLIFSFLLFGTQNFRAQVDSVYYGAPENTKEKKKPREKPPFDWKEKASFGGNFMVWFGSTTYIYLSPTINIAATKRLNLGIGGIYNYRSPAPYGGSVTVYGPYGYALFYVTNNVFVKAECDYLLQPTFNLYSPSEKVWVSYVMLGGGFKQPLGDHAALYTTVMFNVTQTYFSMYPNPTIQIGILAGF